MGIARVLKFVCAALLVVTLGACAGFHQQAFNKTAHGDVKTIGLLEPACADEYYVNNIGHPGMGFGLIGGLIATLDMQSKTNEFTELMKARNFRAGDEFQTALSAELQNIGFTVKVIKPARVKPALLENYDSLDKEVDAYLDPSVGGGYICASSEADYVPTIRLQIRLVKKSSSEIIYEDVIAYGFEFRRLQANTIATEQKYFFNNFSDITNDPDRALEGLRKGIPLIAKRIAQDLNK